MGEKKTEEKTVDAPKKNDAGGVITVVLKVDLHCEGCAKKVRRSIKHINGVDDVKADTSGNKVTVIGKVEPEQLREDVEKKIKKKVTLVSSSGAAKKEEPKKEEKKAEEKKPSDDKKPEAKKEEKKSDEKKPDEKKKEAPVTLVFKIRLHCDGCIQKIRKSILKIKGVQVVSVDAQKDLVTVTGAVDAKNLLPNLKEKLKRSIELVPSAKKEEGGDKKNGGGEKKEDGGGDKKKSGGGDEKKEKSGGDGEKKDKSVEFKAEVNKFEYSSAGHTHEYGPEYENAYMHGYHGHGNSYGHGYPVENAYAPQMFNGYGSGYSGESSHMPQQQMFSEYGNGYSVQSMIPPPQIFHDYGPNGHAPQMFSDENPNACSIM